MSRFIFTGGMTHMDICTAISDGRFLPQAEPLKGRDIIVVKGKHCGLTGVCIWRGANPFGTYYRNGGNDPTAAHNQQVALMGADGKRVYVPIANVRVAGFENDPSAHPHVILTHIRVAGIAGAHGIAIPGVSVIHRPDEYPPEVDDSTPCPSCGRNDCDSPYMSGCEAVRA